MRKRLISRKNYTELYGHNTTILYSLNSQRPSGGTGYNYFPLTNIPKIELGVSKQYMDSIKVFQNQMNNTVRQFQSHLEPIRTEVKSIQSVLSSLSDIIVPKFDIGDFQDIATSIKERYQSFFKECTANGMLPSFKFIDSFEEHFLEFGLIYDEFIISQFEKDFEKIQTVYSSYEVYRNQYKYLELAVNDFLEKRYTQSAMLLFAAMEYIVVYSLLEKERGKYNPLKKALKEDLSDKDRAFIDYEYHTSFKIIVEKYFSNENGIEDPAHINRNRLMHGIMNIDHINKVDCIKLFYVIESMVDLDIKK